MDKDREPVGYCWICDRLLYRDEYQEWVFFNNTLVCRIHPGVEKWYKGALEMSSEKLLLSMERDI
jgi:hypothetical protein